MFCGPQTPTDHQLYSAWYPPHCLLCLLDSLKPILHPNTRTWSKITHKQLSTTQHCDRCPLSNTISEDMRPGGKTASEERQRRKETEDCYLGFGKQEAWKATERKRDVCLPVCQRCFNTRNNTEEIEWVESYQEMRGRKELLEREEWDQTRIDEGRQ